jgi:5-methylthioadenosine/S-adenosylhomocysteine deaminase
MHRARAGIVPGRLAWASSPPIIDASREETMSLLIKNATVLTVDPKRTIIEPGAVYVDGGRIADIGPSAEVEQRRAASAKRVVDGRGKVVCPGFVNIHSHVGFTIFRGRSEDAGFKAPTGLYFPMSTVMTKEDREAIGALNYVELVRSGCTSVMELEEDVEVLAPFVEKLGVRSAMGEMLGDADPDKMVKGQFAFDAKARAEQLERATGFAKRWHGKADGRITVIMAPNMTISSSAEQLKEARAAADKLGLRLTIHLGWSEFEQRTVPKLHGMRSFEFAQKHGLVGKDVVVTHCYVVEDQDIEILAKTGSHLAHCPLMNAFRGLIAPVNDMQKRGINVALGIDNMFGDFFDVIRSAVSCARIKTQNPVALLSTDALEMATINGAKAMGMEKEIGSLEVGKRADLIMLDYRALGLVPVLDPVQNLAYHAHARDVEMVMVDGRVLVDGGEVKTVDRMAVIDRAGRASDSAWARFEKKYGGPMAPVN